MPEEHKSVATMGINVSDLSPKYQQQVLGKILDREKQRKYRNNPTQRLATDGTVIKFDSQKEARRYDQLIRWVKDGHIRDLRLQVDFTLQEAYTDQNGKRVRAIRYVADFIYLEPPEKSLLGSHAAWWGRDGSWVTVVEDVKSTATKTKTYAMKKKMLKEKFGIDISEV